MAWIACLPIRELQGAPTALQQGQNMLCNYPMPWDASC